MMRCIAAIIQSTFALFTCASYAWEELTVEAPNSIQVSVDDFAGRLVDNLFRRSREALPLHHGDLDNSTHGKAASLAVPSAATVVRPLAHFRGSPSARWAPSFGDPPRRCQRRRSHTISRGFAMAVSEDTYYVTTPIYYVNGEPHLGHAYTSVACDVMARFARKCGKETLFLTGTDEHGQKVQQSAEKAGTTPQEFADEVAGKFKHLVNTLGCSHDDFIRTTEERHKAGVQELWRRLEEKGYIYKGAYEGWYSIRDEAFYSEKELVNGKAPTGAEVEWVKEDSYFFKLSAFTEPLLELYKSNPDFIGPDGRREEVVAFVGQEGGLRDLSISRTTFSWGIPVPEQEGHVVYVWLDALTNYITALGYPEDSAKMAKFWPADVHVVGKDILRFHAVFWPAFMMAVGLPLPKRIYAHGWWTKDGEKMSKSIGNVLDPFELVDEYGVDFVRYFLVSEVPFGNDGDFSSESFETRVNAQLANEVGNLVQRTVTMVSKNCDKAIPDPESGLLPEDEALLQAASNALGECQEFMKRQQLHKMVESVLNVARLANKYITVQAPWQIKDDMPRMRTVLYTLAETIRRMAVMLEPVMPASCTKILDLLGATDELRSFASVVDGSRLAPGTPILKPTAIFPRIEDKTQEVDAPAPAQAPAPAPKAKAAPAASLDPEVEVKVKAVGDKIRAVKERLKAEGLSGKSVNESEEVMKLVAELNELKKQR